jgi:hypothetical protein
MEVHVSEIASLTRVATVVVLCAGLALLPNAAAAHDLKTAKNCDVKHGHPTSNCIDDIGCASNWEKVEKQNKFKSADRVYKGTTAWNCHGRTFAARKAWVNYADDFYNCDKSVCPATPKIGDTILWWYGKSDGKKLNGKTKHSVTIVGKWDGLNTIVMSKYSIYGQYRHALRNSVAAYGKEWSPIRFTGGTPIYTNAVGDAPDDHEPRLRRIDRERDREFEASTPEEMLASRQMMPWFDAVVESEAVFNTARAEQVRAVGALRPATLEALQSIDSDELRAQLLVNDLRDPEHYILLGMYNAPELDLLSGMEATRLLRDLADKDDQARVIVTDYLVSLAREFDGIDAARAAAVLAAAPLLRPVERDDLLSMVSATAATDDATYVAGAVEAVRQIEREQRDPN